jgi:hypothetical protein
MKGAQKKVTATPAASTMRSGKKNQRKDSPEQPISPSQHIIFDKEFKSVCFAFTMQLVFANSNARSSASDAQSF